MRRATRLTVALAAVLLAACSSPWKRSQSPEPPTLKTLSSRQYPIKPDAGVTASEEDAERAYRDFLAAAPREPHKQEALRRLGDLQMDQVDTRSANGEATGAADYKEAITRYQAFLKAYPNDSGNDRVLYQLARAYELSGDLETSLATLDKLVLLYPTTRYRDEAQFRRGELLFALREYPKAEVAYLVTMRGDKGSPYYERSLYMHGWALFKQGRLEDGLQSFFGVLDLKLAGRGSESDLEKLPGLTRADRELVEDTFRVTSISLANLQGPASIPPYINSEVRREYEFRVYQQLGELYIRQDRVKDAADTFSAFAQRSPSHPEAPVLQARVIDIYAANGFATLALEAKKQYVTQYGVGSDYQRSNPEGWARNAEPLVKTHLEELARTYHASAQKTKKTEDYQEAVRWYRLYLTSFPQDPQAAQNNFLLAELLYEDARYAEAAVEYEKSAYGYPAHAKSADAGYAALLAYAQQEKRVAAAEAQAVQMTAVESSLRFAQAFPQDARASSVLTNAAEKLYALNDAPRAAAVARQVLELQPPAPAAQRRVAWTVVAHTSFEKGDFADAERAYGEVLALTPDKDPSRAALTERLAASVYKQGEAARAQGQLAEAIGHFNRVASVAPQSPVRANAQYDAAATMLAAGDWDSAARTLEDFRTRYPKSPLQDDVSAKLALAYTEKGSWAQAAGEYEKLAAANKDPKLARVGLWQAAEMYEKAGAREPAARAYERYLKQYPEPLEPALEARWRLAKIAREQGNPARELALMKEVQRGDLTAGPARTDRTRTLGGMATLALARPIVDDYRKVALVEPLKRQLKLKKDKLELALKAYAAAADYGIAEVSTAATFQTAELYRDFGAALMNSQRPKGLKKDELEQYNVMLEEQAYPFEEKAIEVHEINARRTADGIYDKSVRDSIAALGKLRPARYNKVERAGGTVDAIR
ncbi:MAG TPA: tetratricopeptide repeat protein [Burkholderiaceae bacterium]|nr:tetratricopeptide repeat protein [Burkholderiaceae bacterium]HQR69877.1 tetratricopeptide repeat protein [Burkholderiaceae bacterium]